MAVWQLGKFVDANEQTSSLDGRDEVCKALLTARRDRLNRINCTITVAVLDEEEVMPALGQVLLRLLSPELEQIQRPVLPSLQRKVERKGQTGDDRPAAWGHSW